MKSKKKVEPLVFNEKDLQKELMREAKVVGIAVGAAEVIALKIAKRVAGRVAKRTVITMDDLNRFIAEEAEKYNKDLSYVYKNRGKII